MGLELGLRRRMMTSSVTAATALSTMPVNASECIRT